MFNLKGSWDKNVASCADEGKWRLARDRQEHKHWAMMWLRRIRKQIDASQTQMLYKWCCGKIQTKIKLSLGIDLNKGCGRLSDRSIYLNEKCNNWSGFFNIQRFFGCHKRLTGSEEGGRPSAPPAFCNPLKASWHNQSWFSPAFSTISIITTLCMRRWMP